LHADAVATNILEGRTYFQGDRSVDDYLDDFRDLISESGYTSPKTIVVKFRRGLDPEVCDVIATMAAGRPDDLVPEGWYEAAVRIDQNRAMNAAFRGSTEVPDASRSLPCEPTILEAEPKVLDAIPKSNNGSDTTDIKGMSADDIRRLLQQLSQEDKPSTPVLHPKVPKAPAIPTAPIACPNRFQGLAVEEASEESSDPPLVAEASCERQPRKPQWERKLPKQPKIGAAEVGPNSLYLQVEIESTDTQRKYEVHALVDLGATGLFIDREYVKSNQIPTTKLSQAVPVYNVDGSANQDGAISEVAELLLRYNRHSERALFCVTGLGKQNLILGHTWLKDHNPEVDWRTGKVEMSRCSPRCCNGCQTEAQEERKLVKRQAANVNACRTGPFPAATEDSSEMSEDELTSDIPFDLEEGDRVWATRLLPKAEYVQATSTISQRLAETFAKNTEPHLTLLTGGSGSKNPVLDYVKMFGQVFSEEGFAKLPNRKPWDHAIELIPGAQPKGCKVYPLLVTEQAELDNFLTENLETGRIRPSKSPMASLVFFIKKKDSSLRLVQDYRMLNKMTVKNKYPLPLISELVNQLRDAKYFTKLDVRWGFVRALSARKWVVCRNRSVRRKLH
jgi:predicted aspartyl protease